MTYLSQVPPTPIVPSSVINHNECNPSPPLVIPDHIAWSRHVPVYSPPKSEKDSSDDFQAPHSLGKHPVDAGTTSGTPDTSHKPDPSHKSPTSCELNATGQQSDVDGDTFFDDGGGIQFGLSNTTDDNGINGPLEDGDDQGDLESGATVNHKHGCSYHGFTCGAWTTAEIKEANDTKATIEAIITNLSKKYNWVYKDCHSLVLGRLVTRQCYKNPTNGW